jgi:hypothetical protein
MKSLTFLTNIFGRVSKKYNSLSFLWKIICVYTLLAIPFLYNHEDHLPFFVIFILISTTLIVSLATFLLSILSLKQMFRKDFVIWQEALFLFVIIFTVYSFGFFDNQAGVIFLIFVLLFFAFYRIMRAVVYYRIILVGMAIFVNGLLTFKYLQFSEMYLFNRSFQNKYETEEKVFTEWTFDETTRTLKNETLSLSLKLPKEYFFHNPKDLKMKEKTGTGQIAGILSSAETDPNRYPLIRLFYIPQLIKVDPDTIKEEYSSILDFEKHQGNMEEIKNLGEHFHSERKWPGNFWTFYDIIRPRYSKTGFYIFPLKDESYLIIDITENLVENQFHENEIEEVLKSLKQE